MKKMLFIAAASFSLSYFGLVWLRSLDSNGVIRSEGNTGLSNTLRQTKGSPKIRTTKSAMLSFNGLNDIEITNDRDPDEWQGMPPQKIEPFCDGEASCGLAKACIDNKCSACRENADCASGESCVLQHCVLEENVECTTRKECDSDAFCVLSGYSFGVRGNQKMRAFCRATSGGTPQIEDVEEQRKFEEAGGTFEEPDFKLSTLFEGLEYE